MCAKSEIINLRLYFVLLNIFFIFNINAVTAIGNSATNILSVQCSYNSGTDQSDCVQKYIDMASNQHKSVYFKSGTLLLTKPIVLHDNMNIGGNKTIFSLNFSAPYQSAFIGKSVNNINIKNIEIRDDGSFSADKFRSKYPNINKVIGYTNLDRGISIYGQSKNIRLYNIKISGVERAIDIDNSNINSRQLVQNISVMNSQFINLGKVAIRVVNSKNVVIANNTINGVLGNMDDSGDAILANTKFADGIYFSGVINGNIRNNNITNVVRIGIVLEGEEVNHRVININENIQITGNKIYNVNNCRGTENNAGIWVEPSANSDDKFSYKTATVVIENNLIDNAANTTSCANNQYGLFLGAKNNIVSANTIINFTPARNYAINCNYGIVELNNNKLKNNRTNMFTNPKAYYLKVQ